MVTVEVEIFFLGVLGVLGFRGSGVPGESGKLRIGMIIGGLYLWHARTGRAKGRIFILHHLHEL
jgi:hypothetical protein